MKRVYIGLTWTKAQVTSGIPTVVYEGPSLTAAKTATQTPVNAGTASLGGVVSNTDPHVVIRGRNAAGT
jgi:hypothetical protein